MRIHSGLVLLLLSLALLLAVAPVFGQGDFTAILTFDPYPSPYISDWENNPAIGQALITNGTSGTVSVRAFLTIIHDTRGKIASANSRVFEFPPGQVTSLTTRDLIDDQTIDYDHSIRDIAVRTGRLPEGKYRVCLRLETESGTLLLDNQCVEFTILYPDPPYLVFPADGESITNAYPIFQWTPVQVPVGFPVHYDLQIVELLESQTPAQALGANYPQYRNTDVTSTSLSYPVDALALQTGKTYAWQVQVLDDKGFPPSSNNGKSEIWTFRCAIDTTTPIEVRQLAGHVYDAESDLALGSARVVYRAVERKISEGDTTWVDRDDSLVCITDAAGYFKFDSATYQSYYSLSTSRPDYQPVRLAGQGYYLADNTTNLKIKLNFAPPGSRRLAGVLKDFFSNEPVPNAAVEYHVVEVQTVTDSAGNSFFRYVENPRKKLTAITDARGRFEFLQAADSSFFSLRAANPPAYLPAVDMGPDQRQVGDIEDYILLIKPNAGSITGTVRTIVGGKTIPVARAVVGLTRTAVVSVQTTLFGRTSVQTEVRIDSAHASAYSDTNGNFKIQRVSQEKPSTVDITYIQLPFVRIPIKIVTAFASYSYRITVNDKRYRPYLSPDSLVLAPGENTDSGEHLLTPRSGAIVGRVLCDTVGVEGATVYLYQTTYRPPSRNDMERAAGIGDAKGGLGATGAEGG
ncbi:hypothetical protein C3F09_06875, partial [candidate division GN15 bacterium]